MSTLLLLTLLVIGASIVTIILVAMDEWFAGKYRRPDDKPCTLDPYHIIRTMRGDE